VLYSLDVPAARDPHSDEKSSESQAESLSAPTIEEEVDKKALDATEAKMITMYGEGHTERGISNLTGTPKSTVHEILTRVATKLKTAA
jgi:hypothetical protein